jgi:hypothetical protein
MVVHQKVYQEVIVTDIPDSDHLPIIFSILDPVRMREVLEPVEKLRDWELFQSFDFEPIRISKYLNSLF